MGRLIELRGPWKHQSPAERAILEHSRTLIALGCVIKRKRCFLEHHDWKQVPWGLDPQSKTETSALLDILMDLGGLLEDATTLKNSNMDSDCFCLLHDTLSNNIQAHLNQLYSWRAKWGIANPNFCHEVPNYSLFEHSRNLFPTILQFSDISKATTITTYNATLLLLLKLGEEVAGQKFSSSSVSPPISSSNLVFSKPSLEHYPLRSTPQLRAIATEICKSAEYQLLEHHCSVGAFSLVFPLRVAYQTFEQGSPEKDWLERMMKRVAEVSGWEIGRNIGSDEAVGR